MNSRHLCIQYPLLNNTSMVKEHGCRFLVLLSIMECKLPPAPAEHGNCGCNYQHIVEAMSQTESKLLQPNIMDYLYSHPFDCMGEWEVSGEITMLGVDLKSLVGPEGLYWRTVSKSHAIAKLLMRFSSLSVIKSDLTLLNAQGVPQTPASLLSCRHSLFIAGIWYMKQPIQGCLIIQMMYWTFLMYIVTYCSLSVGVKCL